MNFVVIPDLAGLGHVAGFSGINADQIAYTFPMLRVLADGDINAVLVKHWSGVAFRLDLRLPGIDFLPFWRIAVDTSRSFSKSCCRHLSPGSGQRHSTSHHRRRTGSAFFPFTTAREGELHWPWKMRWLMLASSSPINSPVFLLSGDEAW